MTTEELKLNGEGEVKDRKSSTYEVLPTEDGVHRTLIKKNGQPLSPEEIRKEENKRQELLQKQASSPHKWEQKRAKRRRKEEQFWNEVPRAFNFRRAGEETVEQHRLAIIEVTPKSGYKPSHKDFRIFRVLQGKVWIDSADYQVVRAHLEFIDDYKIGAGILAKLHKGATFSIQKKKINDEVWLPRHTELSVKGKVMLFKGFNIKVVSDFSDYRRFETDVDFTVAEDAL